MSQYQSFFVNAFGDNSQCEELNHFLRSHVIIRTVENTISCGNNCGIQILVEYKDIGNSTEKTQKARVDYRSELKTEEQKVIFDKLKAVRLNLAKEKNLKAAYLVCKDEHLYAMVQNPKITEEEIKNLPRSGNILLKQFAEHLFQSYTKLLKENSTVKENTSNEESNISF